MFHFIKSKQSSLIKKPLSLFDVSLRDGLQSFPRILNINEKKNLLDTILNNGQVDDIEIGSIASEKFVPQMKNSLDLYHYANKVNNNYNYYMLVPNLKACKIAIENNIQNLSFITSVSDEFQKKNINKTLHETYKELKNMNDLVLSNYRDANIKIYVSCINNCPISGKINNNFIVDQLININKNLHFSYLCLSDTCGNLLFKDFKYIIDNIKTDINLDKISIHLHEQSDEENIKKILQYAYENDILKYDISSFENLGGCSMTIKEPHSNITRNTLYKSILM